MTKATILKTAVNSSKHVIRIQQRGSKFDVIRNSNGICFMYVAKAVSLDQAKSTFDLLMT